MTTNSPKRLDFVIYAYIIRACRALSKCVGALQNALQRKWYMSNLGCFTCLNCGRNNPIKGHSYTNKYCNNSCQQQHRSRMLVSEWKEKEGSTAWRQIPEYVKKYLIEQRGHSCEVCFNYEHMTQPIPLDVVYRDGNSYNNREDNLQLICPNCRSQQINLKGK